MRPLLKDGLNSVAIVLLAACQWGLSGCEARVDPTTDAVLVTPDCVETQPLPTLGLMTGLPLNLPLGVDFADYARGEVDPPWQAKALGQCHDVIPLDTVSPIAALDPNAAPTNPLSDLARLAIVQPRGLSPQDNVALDDWVRGGGRLLLVLDPMLTGEYDLPLGDARRPNAVAFIPPVVARWGMTITFDDAQEFAARTVTIGDGEFAVLLTGEIEAAGDACLRNDAYPVQQCAVGEGRVTIVADAAIFEDEQVAGDNGSAINALLAFAYDD
ncbi:MAG: hypothetical protein ABJN35_01880 [Erythrobacter sp.]